MQQEQVELSVKDRIILSNQYRILEALYPDEARRFQQLRTIVEKGYELHYDELNRTILESKMTREASEEVMDILDMYGALHYSLKSLNDKSDISEKDIQFEGFDGNNEWNQLAYAHFLVTTERRWQETLEGRPGFDFNSHSRVMSMYRRMLEVWKSLDKKHNLSPEEIKRILGAKRHPGSKID